ncbi:flagellar biosynthetic protein FlhB [Pelomonas saccharophila]|uniref:Flagellar biosynthetic protein FlhB n=1 Tax=Roseateles saccharophilus TaxID=304 RepID=A0ABU1YH87_ROSSA|nr:EscU/YscU/HrcU family type III secretion system export apparatus switch protein [Roseateles saccharophilus]MDR7268227.1 flagellar biosynthetic protein FlhB [Roseateles saccharophilus]
MSREQDLDRNERATPFKLEEARKRGQVARSTEAASFAVLMAMTLGCFALLAPAVKDLAKLLVRGLTLRPGLLDDSVAASRLMERGLHDVVLVLAPLLFAVVVTALLTGLLQSGGLVFSSTPLKPDFARLNPAQGLKKLFSMRLFYEAFKSTLKLAALIATAYLSLQVLWPDAVKLLGLPGKAVLFRVMQSSGGLMAKLCAALLIFVLIDLLFVRWDFLRNLRMSRREIEDEHKHREGDPRIRNRQREIRMQFLKAARSVSKVPEAQVVVTNPTHVAVALRYEHGVTPAPLVVAKGAGMLARQIRRAANKAGVPIVHSPRLARALYKEVPQDAYVPEQWYPPVARILVWLRSLREARGGVRPA